MAKKNDAPKQVSMSDKEIEQLTSRLENNELTKKDIKLLLGIIAFNHWIQCRLARAKLTIKRLRSLFGFTSEAKKKRAASNPSKGNTDELQHDSTETPEKEGPKEQTTAKALWDPEKNHGRTAASDYEGCPVINVSFEDAFLKKGQCPECAKHRTQASVSTVEPIALVFLESQPLISGVRVCLEEARCNVCQKYFKAALPEAFVDRLKYAYSCMTNIAIYHYYAGMPFHRLDMLQKAQGVPLPDATQYDHMKKLYSDTVEPVVEALQVCFANGRSFFFDDTPGRILEQTYRNKKNSRRQDKKGIHATALLSEHEGNRIYLFHTNTLTAGKQFEALLEKRTTEDTFMSMSDASASNFPMLNESLLARWLISLCLSHGRRRFVELLQPGDQDILFVLDIISQVYANEKHCQQKHLNDQERLKYHQKNSAPVMEALRIWLNNLLLFKKVEPNSRFGEAIAYLLKRWQALTQFLRIPGAPIDNNICERAIKVIIRYRKSSLFYRTFYGANIGDAMMSLFHTAQSAGVNLFHYLNTLQQYTEHVQKTANDWLPWNYQKTVAILEATQPIAETP